jgi:anti-sigma regulatory factor (Ser/Thr protein kinase)
MNISFTIPADKKEVPPVRLAVEELVVKKTADKKVAFHAAMIADELCNNAIEYGSKQAGKVRLSITTTKGHIQITCEDEGGETTVRAQELSKKLSQSPSASSIRGRGLTKIVKAFTSLVQIQNNKKGGLTITALIKH